jgi:hypothetical protein
VRYTLRHKIETGVDSFWKLFFDLEAYRSLLEGICTYDLLEERTDSDGIVHRRVAYGFNVKLPDVVKKVVGDGSYVEIGRYDPQAKTYSAQQVPKVGADKFISSFDMYAEPLGEQCCERVSVIDNTVKVFAVGSMLEGMLEKAVRTSQEKAVEQINRWIRETGW